MSDQNIMVCMFSCDLKNIAVGTQYTAQINKYIESCDRDRLCHFQYFIFFLCFE